MNRQLAWSLGFKASLGLFAALAFFSVTIDTNWMYSIPFALSLGLFSASMWGPKQHEPNARQIFEFSFVLAVCLLLIALGLLTTPRFMILGIVIGFGYFMTHWSPTNWFSKIDFKLGT